jgi:hypothetical protein
MHDAMRVYQSYHPAARSFAYCASTRLPVHIHHGGVGITVRTWPCRCTGTRLEERERARLTRVVRVRLSHYVHT